jgi:pantetheine-phosphate adenylyltransferase
MPEVRTAVYPGTFDPVTNGHVDVAERATRLFDRVVIAVARESGKKPLFNLEERVALLEDALNGARGIDIVVFDGLLVEFARSQGAAAIIKGLRAISDFEFEFQMALMNRRLAPELETVFLMTDADKAFLSSSIVKEVSRLGGDVSPMVPAAVARALEGRFRGG